MSMGLSRKDQAWNRLVHSINGNTMNYSQDTPQWGSFVGVDTADQDYADIRAQLEHRMSQGSAPADYRCDAVGESGVVPQMR